MVVSGLWILWVRLVEKWFIVERVSDLVWCEIMLELFRNIRVRLLFVSSWVKWGCIFGWLGESWMGSLLLV